MTQVKVDHAVALDVRGNPMTRYTEVTVQVAEDHYTDTRYVQMTTNEMEIAMDPEHALRMANLLTKYAYEAQRHNKERK